MNRVLWMIQGFTGLLLLLVLGMHFLANHTASGLLSYSGAIQRFQDPATLTVEAIFLVLVVYHAFNGLCGVVKDYLRSDRWNRAIARVLTAAGAAATVYGVWLGWALNRR